jgi:hypothetical protein
MRSEIMARNVDAKKVKNAAAKESRRLWKRLNPCSGKPRSVPVPVWRRFVDSDIVSEAALV